MFSFHWPELLILLVIAAIFFPRRLPQLGSALGQSLRGLRRSMRDLDEQTGLSELKEMGKREARELKALATVDLSERRADTSDQRSAGSDQK